MSILTQGVDISTLGTSSGITNASTVVGATVTDALNTINTTVSTAYHWTWANATARTAQAVTAAEIGFKGYQTDLAADFQLIGTSPTRWGYIIGDDVGPLFACLAQNNSAAFFQSGFALQFVTGTATARVAAQGTVATALTRVGHVTAAGAGSASLIRATTGGSVSIYNGLRIRTQFTLSAVSATMRWYAGCASAVAATNFNPNTLIEAIGIGRDNQANVQFYNNDAAGTCTVTDLGAAFPATTLNSAYELLLYAPLNALSWAYNVRNMVTNAEVSGVVTTNIPAAAGSIYLPFYYVCNNTDAVAVAQDLGGLEVKQVTR